MNYTDIAKQTMFNSQEIESLKEANKNVALKDHVHDEYADKQKVIEIEQDVRLYNDEVRELIEDVTAAETVREQAEIRRTQTFNSAQKYRETKFEEELAKYEETVLTLQGPEGPEGPEGPRGFQGDKGDPGEKGETGEQGPEGPQGEQGVRGEQGIPGEKGEKGDPGIQGPEGPRGEKGEKGDPGIQGEQGIAGINGQDGRDGADGITPNVQIGTVTTLPSDQNATVTRTGTNENPIFSFAIPRGPNGVFIGSKEDAPAWADIVIDDSDEGFFGGNKLVETSITGDTLTLTTSKYQTTTMTDNTTIVLPTVDRFTEIHLFFNTTSELTLQLPVDVKWQTQPTIEANKTYEFIFTYTTEWLGGCVSYA